MAGNGRASRIGKGMHRRECYVLVGRSRTPVRQSATRSGVPKRDADFFHYGQAEPKGESLWQLKPGT
jgi:hypothetical protein